MGSPKLDLDDYRIAHGADVELAKRPTDDTAGFDKETAKELAVELGEQLTELQAKLYAQNLQRVLVVIQAMDTGGKDGLVKHLLLPVNPQGVRIAAFKAPTEIELHHDFLWRVHHQVPANGELVVFNRSHYEDVLIVRVHDLVAEKTWRRRYDHIRNFERQLTDEGTTIVKFFLHISKDEQKKRLEARVADPTKHWKFNTADLDERRRWDDYQAAYTDAIAETSAAHAPWYVIPADRKWFRDLVVAKALVHHLDQLDLTYPESEDLSGVVID